MKIFLHCNDFCHIRTGNHPIATESADKRKMTKEI